MSVENEENNGGGLVGIIGVAVSIYLIYLALTILV